MKLSWCTRSLHITVYDDPYCSGSAPSCRFIQYICKIDTCNVNNITMYPLPVIWPISVTLLIVSVN